MNLHLFSAMSFSMIAAQALSTKGIRKTTLATSITLLVGGFAAPSALAALPTTATLTFTLGTVGATACIYGTTPPCIRNGYNITDIVGSYFSMDIGGDGVDPADKTPIGSFNGLVIGTTQLANGSHSGSINGSEAPNIDATWNFFSNTGMHQTTANTTIATDSGNSVTLVLPWSVNWNGLGDIPMVSLSPPTVTCGATCTATDTYTLDGAYHVAGAGFTSVAYTLHLEGNVTVPGQVPIAKDDTTKTVAGNPRVIDVTSNDNTPAGDSFTPNSVTITANGANGGAAPNVPASNVVTYTPTAGFTGQDTFVYTVNNSAGTSLTSAPAPDGGRGVVTVDVQANVAPVAVDDPDEKVSAQELDQSGGSIPINVLANDSDANNDPGLPGGIDVTTVAASVINAPGNIGTCVGNADGTITYFQTLPSVIATDSCIYTVKDIDTAAGSLTSNTAAVAIIVNTSGDTSSWPTTLPPGVIPILAFNPGAYTVFDSQGKPDQTVEPENSWFRVQLSASTRIYTPIEPGPDGGLIVGYDQPATGSHTGRPDGTEQTSYMAPWQFFSNTGFDLTRNGGITGNPDGTLEFRTRYFVTWNGINAINLGGSSEFPEDTGSATIVCNDIPCQHNSTFVLDYAAHVEDIPGFAQSGFNGVPYALHQEGTINFLDGNLKVSNGTVTTETRLAASEVVSDNEVDLQCVGSCFDYTVENTTSPGVAFVLPQAGGVPNSPVWRILDNGKWRNFDTSASDSVKSAPAVAGADDLRCPEPDNPAYIDLSNDTAVNVGHQCIQLTVRDNGLNDLNPEVGIVSGSGGLGASVTALPSVIPVSIDIKPGNRHNAINPRAKGGIWVAVSSHTNPQSPFDPSSQVDIPTVKFGPDGAKVNRYKVKDINRDGLGDLLLRFKIPDTGIACGDTEATLTGVTFYGSVFTGTDSIKTVGCKPGKRYKKKHHGKHHDDDDSSDDDNRGHKKR